MWETRFSTFIFPRSAFAPRLRILEPPQPQLLLLLSYAYIYIYVSRQGKENIELCLQPSLVLSYELAPTQLDNKPLDGFYSLEIASLLEKAPYFVQHALKASPHSIP